MFTKEPLGIAVATVYQARCPSITQGTTSKHWRKKLWCNW